MDLTLFKKPLSFPCCVLAIATCLFSACKEPEPDIKPEDALLIEFTEKTLSNKASEFSMDVTANCDWTFTVDANWAYIIEPRSQYNGSKKLTIGVLKNETTSERTATFVFQYSKGSAVLKVIQTAFEVYLNVSVQDVLFGYRNAEKVITVTSNCGWDAKSDQEWLAIKPITGLVGSFEMTLETGTNDGTADRTAQVRIWNTKYGLSQVVSVTQLKRNGTNIKDYVDEYGINRGEGLIIGELEWAPVN